MKRSILLLCAALVLAPCAASAQDYRTHSGAGAGSGAGFGSDQATGPSTSSSSQTTSTSKDGRTTPTSTVKTDDNQPRPQYRMPTNVQIELTITDQNGTQAPEKKSVSMIAASGNWGKIRSAANFQNPGESPQVVELNVDARPLVPTEGQIQLELTIVYAPVKNGESRERRPTGINQSQTVVLTSGKPLVISQASDPVSDRKVVVEVKATILK
jgi:hypothetical protein